MSPSPRPQARDIYPCLYNHGNRLYSLSLRPLKREEIENQFVSLLLLPALPQEDLVSQ